MTYEEAVKTIPVGKYRHFKGNEYEVISIARHSETTEPMVVYRALYGDHGVWVRPAEMLPTGVYLSVKVNDENGSMSLPLCRVHMLKAEEEINEIRKAVLQRHMSV